MNFKKFMLFHNNINICCYFILAGDPQVVDFMKKNYPSNFKYADFAPKFTPEFFDPNKFPDLVQASSAK